MSLCTSRRARLWYARLPGGPPLSLGFAVPVGEAVVRARVRLVLGLHHLPPHTALWPAPEARARTGRR